MVRRAGPRQPLGLSEQRVEQERFALARRRNRIALGVESGSGGRRIPLLLRSRRRWQERRWPGWRRGDGRLGCRAWGQFEVALAAAAGKAKGGRDRGKRTDETATMGQKPLPQRDASQQIRRRRRHCVGLSLSGRFMRLLARFQALAGSRFSQRLAAARTLFGAVPPKTLRLATDLSTESTP